MMRPGYIMVVAAILFFEASDARKTVASNLQDLTTGALSGFSLNRDNLGNLFNPLGLQPNFQPLFTTSDGRLAAVQAAVPELLFSLPTLNIIPPIPGVPQRSTSNALPAEISKILGYDEDGNPLDNTGAEDPTAAESFNLAAGILSTVAGGTASAAGGISLLLAEYSSIVDPIFLGLEADSFYRGLGSEAQAAREATVDSWGVAGDLFTAATGNLGSGSIISSIASGELITQIAEQLGNLDRAARLIQTISGQFGGAAK
eukprot:gene2389-8697_t